MNPKAPIETITDVTNALVGTVLEIARHEAEIARLEKERAVLIKILLPRYREIIDAKRNDADKP